MSLKHAPRNRLVPCVALCIIVAFVVQIVRIQRMNKSPKIFQSFFGEATTTPGLPIFILGLPRTGSIAFHEYFACRGISSSHYCCRANDDDENSSPFSAQNVPTSFPCKQVIKTADDTDKSPSIGTCGDCILYNMQRRRPPLQGCGGYQVWSQFDVETTEPSFAYFLPQHFALPLLHEAYPNATWILNTRGKAWSESVMRWHSITKRMENSFRLDENEEVAAIVPPTATREELVKEIDRNLERYVRNDTEHQRRKKRLDHVHKDHIDRVRAWAKQYPSHYFLEMDLEGSDNEMITKTLDDLAIRAGLGTGESSCKFRFDPTEYDSDWKNFTLPFGIKKAESTKEA